MPTYVFSCISPEHEGDRSFTAFIHHVPKKVIERYTCPSCGGLGKRDLSQEIPTQHVTGLTPISHSTTGPGSLARETQMLMGKWKRNPDGTIDHNHRPIRDSGELSQYMNGRNDLGDPVLMDNGQPMRRKDGSIVRRGAKLFKYGPNATPSRSDMRRIPDVPSAWVDAGDTRLAGANGLNRHIPGVSNAPRRMSPERRKR